MCVCIGLPSPEENPGCSLLTKRIAATGSYGRHPQNCERDLHRVLDLPLDARACFQDVLGLTFRSPGIVYELGPRVSVTIRKYDGIEDILWEVLKPSYLQNSKDFYYVTVPIRDLEDERPNAETEMRVPMILPHELLDYISAASITYVQVFFI